MRQSGYAIALAFVLVAMVAGAFFGGRLAIQRFRQDFQFREQLPPSGQSTSSAPEATLDSATEAAVPTARPSATSIVIPTPIVPTPQPFSPQPEPTARPTETAAFAPAEATRAETGVPSDSVAAPSPSPEPIVQSAEPFRAKGAVRDSQGDCGGTYVLGLVIGPGGDPLPGVRLRLVDEFENEAFAVTKSGQADLGRYDFPVAGPPRRFSLSVVDENGASLSRTAAFTYYGDTPDAQATCYWVDWQQR